MEAARAEKAWESLGDKYGTALAKLVQAHFYFEGGELEAALRVFSEYQKDILDAQPQAGRQAATENDLWRALVEWRRGRIESARQKLDPVQLLFSDRSKERVPLAAQLEKTYEILQAEIWLAEGRTTEVIDFMEKDFALQVPYIGPAYARILTWHNFPSEQDVLARAYQKTGSLDKAVEEYQKLITFNPAGPDRRLLNPVYHYRLAKLYEQKGLKPEAKKEYARFLDLWKNADPGLPELVDAKKRFAQLS